MDDDFSPARLAMEMAQEALAAGKKLWIRIAGPDTWYRVGELSFVDGSNEYLMTALLDAADEGQRMVFPAASFIAVRFDEAE